MVNFTNVKRHNKPFILASRASQVFYVEDPIEKGWHVVISTNARFLYKMNTLADFDVHLQSEACKLQDVDPMIKGLSWVREDGQGVEIDISQL